MAKINNPRFPHTCKVYRPTSNPDPFGGGGGEETVYEGVCRKYTNTAKFNEVIVSEYGISIPQIIQIKVGYLIQVTDYMGTFDGNVVKVVPSNMGMQILFNVTGQ